MRIAHLILYIAKIFRLENYWSCPLVCGKSYRPLKNVHTGFGVHKMDSACEGLGGWGSVVSIGSKSAAA